MKPIQSSKLLKFIFGTAIIGAVVMAMTANGAVVEDDVWGGFYVDDVVVTEVAP